VVRSPPLPRPEPDAVPPPPPPPPGIMVLRTFTFGPADVGAIRSGLPPGLRDTATTFEVLAAALFWGVPGVGLPAGYYGNACVPVPVPVRTTVEGLTAGSLGDTVELVREAKATVTAEYLRSVAVDLGVLRRRPYKAMANVFLVSDCRRAGFHCLDFGWGVPVYGGPSAAVFGISFLIAVRNGDGENAAAMPIMLPRPAMDRFAVEVERFLKD
jgi:benzyl alcohol O-benzoyltransferase